MAKHTSKLNLYKVDPTTDGNETFNIKTMLNDNWDKVDNKVGSMSDKLHNVEADANNYIHPAKHSADMITVNDIGNNFSSGNVEDVLEEVGTSLSAIAYQQATVNSREIQLTVPSFSFIENKYILVEITTDISEGSALTVKVNSDTAIALKDSDDNALTSLDKGFYTFIARTGTPNFFLQAPKGGGVQPIQKAHEQGTETVVGEVKAGQYVYSNVDLINDDGTPVGNVKVNDNNSYYISATNNYVFYSNADDGYKLYKVDHDGNNNVKVIDIRVEYIFATENFIFYQHHPSGGKLYRVNHDGSNNIKLTDDIIYKIFSINNYVFYGLASTRYLFRVDIDGSNRTQLNSVSSDWTVASENYVFYRNHNDDGSLYRMNIDGTNTTKLVARNTNFYSITKNYVFYNDVFTEKLYRMNHDGTDNIVLNNAISYYISATENYVFYINKNDNKIYRINHDGTNKIELSEALNFSEFVSVSANGKNIFYRNTNLNGQLFKYVHPIIIPSVENGVESFQISQPTNTNQYQFGVSYAIKVAQSFTPRKQFDLSRVKASLFKYGNPSDGCKCLLYDSDTSTLLAESNVISGTDLTTVKDDVFFEFNNYTLISNKLYHLVFQRTNTSTDNANYYRIGAYNSGDGSAYTDGYMYTITNTWNRETAIDLTFTIYSSTDDSDTQFKTLNAGTLKVASDHDSAQVVGCISKKALGWSKVELVKIEVPDSVGDEVIYTGQTSWFKNEGNNNWRKVREIKIKFPLTYRISLEIERTIYGTSYVQIYKNGSALGILRTISNGSGKVTFTEDLNFEKGDTLQICGMARNDYNAYFSMTSFTIKASKNGYFDTIL